MKELEGIRGVSRVWRAVDAVWEGLAGWEVGQHDPQGRGWELWGEVAGIGESV